MSTAHRVAEDSPPGRPPCELRAVTRRRPVILKRVRRPARPGFSLADPTNTARHATSLTLQPRQSPPAMRPASPCSPGNCRPPCDQPTLQTRQPPPARHAALPPYRPNRCRTAQAVPRKTDGCSTFTALPPPPPQPKGIEGGIRKGPQLAGGRGGEGRNRKAHSRIRQGCEWQGPLPESLRVTGHSRKGPQLAGVAEGRGTIGRPAAVSGMGLRRVRRSFFAGFVPFASLNIRFERVPTTPQPYFCFRKRFTPRPHTHQIQPVAAPRQRSAPAGGSRDRHLQRLEDPLPFRPSVRHPETHESGCRFVGS